ncbi:EAL domain-containing protein [Lusitaniella coriacea LEGE 07157]|uniref:EAL domain-containing protein n=2 Tax=Lusitaniella TaxID=1983104 RepID=A0A8J7DVH4_9CYAN|nr:EAL domain-containing protein [Lusitaniella coriacea LEGE 07157]
MGTEYNSICQSMKSTLDRICLYPGYLLIADDASERFGALCDVLRQRGHRICTVSNTQKFLTIARKTHPDLVLLDIGLSSVSGYEVCQCLKADLSTAQIPVIFLGTPNQSAEQVTAFSMGGLDYIPQPLPLEELLFRIEYHLATLAMNRKIRQLSIQVNEWIRRQDRQMHVANEQMVEIALYDALTGLPNRALFINRLTQVLHLSQNRHDAQFAVLLLDCARFKVVNNIFGHDAGDRFLREIIRRLQGCLSQVNALARLNGDEFAILLSDVTDLRCATQAAEKILEVLLAPFCVQGHDVFINGSIGIVWGDRDYREPEHLLRDADTAAYCAKKQGSAGYRVFDPTMSNPAFKVFQMETDLRRSLQHQDFQLYYQPIVSLDTGKIVGFEALVRWKHPLRGLISPVEFIPVAEETGLIVPLGQWILYEACRQLRYWQTQGAIARDITMSVNFSARQFSQPDLIEQIDRILAETQLNPQNLKLEITESSIMENTEIAAAMLHQLRQRHIQLSIDDFGTGYSSLSYLHAFPVNTLKIDRTFVQRLNGTPETLGLIPAILSIAKTMGMSVVAEGIETPQQLEQLRALSCDFSQGYFFSHPLAAQQIEELIITAPEW